MGSDSDKLLPPSFLHLDQPAALVSDTSPPEDHLTRTAVLCRVGLFGILEVGFLVLSSVALLRPIILHLPSGISLTEAKGGFTALFIAWHALAVAIAKDILLHVFSGELLAQYERTGRLESQKTDRVSKLTTGLIGQAKHLFSGRATVRYRLAMILMLLLMTLGGLAPSTAVVTNVSVDAEVDLSVANLTFPRLYDNATEDWLPGPADDAFIIDTRANSILRLELFEKVMFGFQAEDNLVIPWPSKDLIASDGRITYITDVLSFDFNCAWYKPTPMMTEATTILQSEGPFTYPFMSMPNMSTTHYTSSWLFFKYPRNDKPDSDFGSPSLPIDLTGLPTTPSPELAPDHQDLGSPYYPEAATALVCDPQFTVYPAQITVRHTNLHTKKLEGHPSVGNIGSEEMLRNQYLASLIPDLTAYFDDSVAGISSNTSNSVARLLLFCHENNPCDTVFKPFPLPTINQNMNRFFRSASKAFSDGYNGTLPGVETISVPNFNTFQTKGVGQVDEMALVASKLFFIAYSAILTAIAALLITLCWLIRKERLVCFNLDNVSELLIDELEKTGSIITRSPMTSPLNASVESSFLGLPNAMRDGGVGLRRCRTCSQNFYP